MSGVGVIVVGDSSLHGLLRDCGADWNVQERQDDVPAMWDALSSGRLDVQSRILVFSDSTADGTALAGAPLTQLARAIVAMAHAGAVVCVAERHSASADALRAAVDESAAAQGLEPQSIRYRVLPSARGPLATLDAIRDASGELVDFPAAWPAGITASSALPTSPVAPGSAALPQLPPIGALDAPIAGDTSYPPSASLELLNRPRLPGQVTITVTSSKGGSGKSTASILLAASIARASREAGKPLSVCLIDLDTRDGQVASLIGTFMPTALNIRVQPVWDEERIRRNVVHADGLDIDTILAPIRPRTADTVGPEFYQVIVRSLQRMFDVVVMDTSVQYLDPLISDVALREADEILFVTTLASTAVQGMARALREITAPVDESGLGVPREKIGIIVNQSVANVGMEREQVLAAGLGVPVVGVIPLATKDVLTATNLNRMHELLDHPLVGPAYVQLAQACLPGRDLAAWAGSPGGQATGSVDGSAAAATSPDGRAQADVGGTDDAARKRGLFRRG